MPQVSWTGVYPALLTPFTNNDEIDFPLFSKNLDAQLHAGIHGIVLGGTLGEASTLETDEKTELLRFAVDKVAGRIPVILNVVEQSTRGAIRAAKLAEDNGADGLMVLPPMRYKSDDNETVQYFSEIAKNVTLPIMIYNNPVDYKILVTIEMFEELAELDNIQAVKESTRDITNITRMVNRFGNRFRILTGVDTLAMESLCLGADGWVAGLCDAFPEETVAIYQLVKENRIEEALAIYRWFMPLLELDIHPKLVQFIKLAATATGLGSEHVRAPRLKITGAERESVQSIINNALKNRPALPVVALEFQAITQ